MGQFTDLARLHPDGWGAAWWNGGPAPSTTRSTRCAADDPGFARLRSIEATNAALLHLRWATPGLAVSEVNCHPFWYHDLAMAHVGTIYPLDDLDGIVPPGWDTLRRGTTDSERYALAVAASRAGSIAGVAGGVAGGAAGCGAAGCGAAGAVADVVGRLFAGWMPTSLDALCLTAESLVAVCAYDPETPAPVELGAPVEEYYAISYRATEDVVVAASSGVDQLPDDGWQPLANMTLLEVDRATLAVSERSLGPG